MKPSVIAAACIVLLLSAAVIISHSPRVPPSPATDQAARNAR